MWVVEQPRALRGLRALWRAEASAAKGRAEEEAELEGLGGMKKREVTPLRLKINHIVVEVRALDHKRDFDGDDYGWFLPCEQAIYIHAEQPASEQVRILFHELLHVMWWAYNIPKESRDEEHTCDVLESPLAALHLDNPHLSDVLKAAFDGKPIVVGA